MKTSEQDQSGAHPFELHASQARLLSGRHALVTGGDSGIGQAICYELAAHGAAVAINYVGAAEEAGSMVEQIKAAGGSACAVAMDVSSEQDVQRAFGEAREAIGSIDLLVNNAGVEHPYPLLEMPFDAWQKVIDVNLTGAFLCAREAARMMHEAGKHGAILNISSVHEQIPWESFSHYCASKGGMRLFAQSIAKELAPLGIRVASVAPGAIETPINAQVLADHKESAAVRAEIPLGRWGKPHEIARTVAWLASDQAAYITGATLFVDGGMTLYPRFT